MLLPLRVLAVWLALGVAMSGAGLLATPDSSPAPGSTSGEVWFPPPESGSPDAIRWDGNWDPAVNASAAVLTGNAAETQHASGALRPTAEDDFLTKLLAQKRPLLMITALLILLVGGLILRAFLNARPPDPPGDAPPPR